ncbi:MAG: phosphate signaling complex protein PhoU [Thermodesulfobacteriota bacterium]|nr:phosphate signaling complex protein PhoU [Thermodesulfobacteriota bacterium]
MAANLQKEMNKIKKQILSLGGMVENSLKTAVTAVRDNDALSAQQIIDSDIEIDELEVEIEEECLKLIALYQPVAIDLRFLIVVIKINNDLERIADLAANICRRITSISGKNLGNYVYDYHDMSEQTALMLKTSLDAMVAMDSDMAEQAIKMDMKVNDMRNEAYDTMKTAIIKSPQYCGRIVNRYLISRHLERIGDHIKNIAEEVIHLVRGEIVRHEYNV